ncbi:MAG: hypothetical protein K2X29_09060 [Candidatus Obscuribacterales bacterium]|nr:hypothetical protein [Candidatus Obscuribacterales bacterium]
MPRIEFTDIRDPITSNSFPLAAISGSEQLHLGMRIPAKWNEDSGVNGRRLPASLRQIHSEVAGYLGHSSLQTTYKHYARFIKGDSRLSVKQVEAFIQTLQSMQGNEPSPATIFAYSTLNYRNP